MKAMLQSSASSARTPSTAPRRHPDSSIGTVIDATTDGCCNFPGCRRDTNCHCKICRASFDATRDLLQNSSLSKASSFRHPSKNFGPSAEPSTPPSTPEPLSSLTAPASPPTKSTAKSRPLGRQARKEEERGRGIGWCGLVVLVGFCVFLAVDSGVLGVGLKGLGPKLAPELVRGFGEEVRIVNGDLKGRLKVLEKRIEGVVGGGVSNCSSLDSVWKLNQEGHLFFFQWRCVLYQSVAEKLSIWGSPLQTSGFLSAENSPRSLVLLSGKITEWSERKLIPTLRMNNGSSWTLEKWSSAAVQLEGNTWVLEYQRSALFQGSGLIPTAWEILRLRAQRMMKRLKWKILLRKTFGENHFKHPT